jgi:hypothetical protein
MSEEDIYKNSRVKVYPIYDVKFDDSRFPIEIKYNPKNMHRQSIDKEVKEQSL